jgi:5-hydroxyisourate hydrolase-like protein (transthyretin family)
MLSIKLTMDESVSQKVLDFLNGLPSQSVTIDNIELTEEEIKQKLAVAEQDIVYNRTHSVEEVRQTLIG